MKKGEVWCPLLIPLVFFNLEPAVQYVTNFFTIRKYMEAKRNENVSDRKKYYDRFIAGNRRVSDLKYSESLMEAIPQFILQGYILLTTYNTLVWNEKCKCLHLNCFKFFINRKIVYVRKFFTTVTEFIIEGLGKLMTRHIF